MKYTWMYIFPVLGFFAPLVFVIIWSLTHQKQIKAALKDKQPDTPYENKLPANYSPRQKKWTIVIALYMFAVLLISLSFLFSGQRLLVSLFLPLAMLGWLGLIKLGNRVTKKNT